MEAERFAWAAETSGIGMAPLSKNSDCWVDGPPRRLNLRFLPEDENSPYPQPQPILLRPGDDVPVDVVSSFSSFGSVLSADCSSDSEVASRITRTSQAFRSLSHLLWYQKNIKSRSKIPNSPSSSTSEFCDAMPQNHCPRIPMGQAA